MMRNRKGFGVEDAPFMILATVMVIMLVAWLGISIVSEFVEGNEMQAAVDASTDIYKRAKLLSLGYEGSSDRITVMIPQGYSLLLDGSITPQKETYVNESFTNYTPISESLGIRGIPMLLEGNDTLPQGRHQLRLIYEDGTIYISQ